MEQIRNVVVFGDSLSDIGNKANSVLGKFAIALGEMTVSPTGRFSDCRNWTDYMYEEASGGKTLLGPDVKEARAASARHFAPFDVAPNALNNAEFRYANYAEGGACGGIPAAPAMRLALGSFKDQVEKFGRDYGTLEKQPHDITLFIIWFGANDLFTAKCRSETMTAVAAKVAKTRRNELRAIVGGNARFIFLNMAAPRSAARYQRMIDRPESAQYSSADAVKARGLVAGLELGVRLYNMTLKELTDMHHDSYVDIGQTISPDNIANMLEAHNLLIGVQDAGASNQYISSRKMDKTSNKTPISTSDEVHPTDRVYGLIWEKIRSKIIARNFQFGLINS